MQRTEILGGDFRELAMVIGGLHETQREQQFVVKYFQSGKEKVKKEVSIEEIIIQIDDASEFPWKLSHPSLGVVHGQVDLVTSSGADSLAMTHRGDLFHKTPDDQPKERRKSLLISGGSV